MPNYLIRWCDERVEKVFPRKSPLQHLLRFHSVPDGALDNSRDASVGLTAAQVYNFSTDRGGQPRLGGAKSVYRTEANPLPPTSALARRYQSCKNTEIRRCLRQLHTLQSPKFITMRGIKVIG